MIITSIFIYILANYADRTEAMRGCLNIRAALAVIASGVLALLVGTELALLTWRVFVI